MLYIHSSNGTFVINNSLILPVWWGTQWFMKHALMWFNSLSPALRRMPEREHLWWKSTSHFFSQFWLRSMLPCGIARPQWVNKLWNYSYVQVMFLAALWAVESVCPSVCPSVRLSVCPSHLFDYVPIIVSSRNFQELLPMTEVMSMQKVKVKGQRSRSQKS